MHVCVCVLMRNVWDPPEAATASKAYEIRAGRRARGADNGVTGLEVIAP